MENRKIWGCLPTLYEEPVTGEVILRPPTKKIKLRHIQVIGVCMLWIMYSLTQFLETINSRLVVVFHPKQQQDSLELYWKIKLL